MMVRITATAIALLGALSLPAAARAQQPCTRLGTWWQIGSLRVQQVTGSGQKVRGIAVERQYVDRRTMRRTATGFQLDIRRTKLGLRDETVDIGIEFGPTGLVTRLTGDTAALGRDFGPLQATRCSDLKPGAAIPDRGARVDTTSSPAQRSVTRLLAANSATVGVPIDTLGLTLLPVFVRRAMSDSSSGLLLRQQANQPTDTVRSWTTMSGEELERHLIRVTDGAVIFREQARRLTGQGWAPPFDITDTVPVRMESASIERVVDSSAAAGVLNFPRRGEVTVSAAAGDTAALHYREWRGDTLVLRMVRRNGWRNELRSVWRDSSLLVASLYEPGSAVQPPGPYWRPFRVQKGFLFDSGSKDSSVAIPSPPWSLALDGFEEMIVPALMTIPVDEKPHRLALYAVVDGRGSWLAWSAAVANRGNVRVAKLYTLQRKWAGSFIFTQTGELLFSSLGGAGGVLRVPMNGTRLAGLLQAAQATVQRADLVPVVPSTPAPAPPTPAPSRKP
jgi:hypothetical protein